MSPDVTHLIIYASSPRQCILGIVAVRRIHQGTPQATWRTTLHGAGISRTDFLEYFAGADKAYAIEIDPASTVRLGNEVSPQQIIRGFRVPQSFMYVSESFLDKVVAKGF